MVVALGQGSRLVGITHACTPPKGSTPQVVTRSSVNAGSAGEIDRAVSEAYRAGNPLFHLDELAIERLEPDLILTQALCEVCAVNETEVRSLANRLSPTPRIETLAGTTIDGILEDVRRVANALDVPEEGEELELALRVRMRSIHQALKSARAPRPSVAVIEWTDPPYAAGHWVPEMIHRAGGLDVLAKPGEHSRPRTAQEISSANPEHVLIAPCGYTLDAAEEEGRALFGQSGWEWLDSRNVWVVHSDALTSRPGPSIVDGIETIARILHPAIFPPPSTRCARRLKSPSAA
jgi:iron complex transport system substrate-binding protein